MKLLIIFSSIYSYTPHLFHLSNFTPLPLTIYGTTYLTPISPTSTISLSLSRSFLPLSATPLTTLLISQLSVYKSLNLMGFPVGYTDLFLPKLLLHILTLLGFIRKFISFVFRFVGLGDFLEPEFSTDPTRNDQVTHFHSVSAVLIRELLPVVKFSELVDPPESCAVCLYEFDAGDEIRRLTNCRHIFHRSCLDRWMDHDQKTCPLCRTPFIPDDLQDSFNERLWAASGVADYYGDSSLVSSS